MPTNEKKAGCEAAVPVIPSPARTFSTAMELRAMRRLAASSASFVKAALKYRMPTTTVMLIKKVVHPEVSVGRGGKSPRPKSAYSKSIKKIQKRTYPGKQSHSHCISFRSRRDQPHSASPRACVTNVAATEVRDSSATPSWCAALFELAGIAARSPVLLKSWIPMRCRSPPPHKQQPKMKWMATPMMLS